MDATKNRVATMFKSKFSDRFVRLCESIAIPPDSMEGRDIFKAMRLERRICSAAKAASCAHESTRYTGESQYVSDGISGPKAIIECVGCGLRMRTPPFQPLVGLNGLTPADDTESQRKFDEHTGGANRRA